MKHLYILIILCVISHITFAQTPYLVKDIDTIGASEPHDLTAFNGKLFFVARDEENGYAIWESDGTEGGTRLFFDTDTIGLGNAYNLFVHEDKMFFMGDDGIHYNELWVTDGTVQGTHMVKDILMPGYWAFSQYMASYNGLFYFNMWDDNGAKLWVTDGTESGTYELDTAIRYPSALINYNGKLYFQAKHNGSPYSLCSTDGTVNGVQVVAPIRQDTVGHGQPVDNAYAVVNNKLVFWSYDTINGAEPWVSDGTNAGTHILKDICTGFGDGNPANFKVIGGTLYFSAFDSINRWQPWVSDGTSAGTHVLSTILPYGGGAGFFTKFNDKVYFSYGGRLAYTDGTQAGTDTIDYINYSVQEMLATNDKLYFVRIDNGLFALSYVDTNNYTFHFLEDTVLNPYVVVHLTEAYDKVFFSARSVLNNWDYTGDELWAIDSVSFDTPDTTATGIKGVSIDKDIKLYPNPNKGSFTISTNGELISNVDITNLNGQHIAADFSTNNNVLQLQLKDKIPGLYFAKLRYVDGRTSNYRFVVSE